MRCGPFRVRIQEMTVSGHRPGAVQSFLQAEEANRAATFKNRGGDAMRFLGRAAPTRLPYPEGARRLQAFETWV
jgi:hypothetical protein